MTVVDRAEAPQAVAGDLLLGAEAIAEFIYGTKKARGKVYHLRRSSNVPIGYLGSQLCARRSRLLEWIKEQEDKNLNKIIDKRASNLEESDDDHGRLSKAGPREVRS